MFATVASSAGAAVEWSTIRFGDRLVRTSRASHLHKGQARVVGPNDGRSRLDQANSPMREKYISAGTDVP
jgi:hypothetical protein